MIKVLRVFAGAVLLFAAVAFWMGVHPVAAGVSLAAAVVLLGWEALLGAFDRGHARVLPKELERLAWRSDETAVAFIWRFRRGREYRVRILRSEEGYADRRKSTGHDQTVVFDAQGDQALDPYVQPRRTYFYSFLVERTVGRPAIVRLEIPTLSPEERRQIEATLDGPEVLWGYQRDGLRTASHYGRMSPSAAVLGEILGGIATEAVFAVAELFAGERLPEDWVEVE